MIKMQNLAEFSYYHRVKPNLGKSKVTFGITNI